LLKPKYQEQVFVWEKKEKDYSTKWNGHMDRYMQTHRHAW